MLIYILLFLFLSLLVSIVMCRDDKTAMTLLFLAHFSLIAVVIYLTTIVSPLPSYPILRLECPGSQSEVDEPVRVTEDQLNEQENAESLKPLDFEDLTDNLEEIKPAKKTKK